MNVLESRTYAPDATMRKRLFTPDSLRHPAKMHLALCRDLFLRYTQPGQTVLDPFFGIGTSLIGAALPEPRNIIGHELEQPFVELARGNWDKIKSRTLPGMPLGDVTILQGDSRHLPLPDAECDVACSSPPFADSIGNMESTHVLRAKLEAKHGRTFAGSMNGQTEYGHTPGQIGSLSHTPSAILSSPPYADQGVPQMTTGRFGDIHRATGKSAGRIAAEDTGHGANYADNPANIGNLPHAAITSPPYSDLASRNRSEEPSSLDSPYAESHGKAAPNRHVDGYGETPGQIGGLVHAALSSPPWADVLPKGGETKGVWGGDGYARAKRDYSDYGHSDGQIGAEDGETYSQAVLAVYRECYRVIRPGGVLVLVTGDYIRGGVRVDLASDTIQLAVAAGWTPVERWQHAKAQVSFWRRLYAKRNPEAPAVTSEDVLVFVKHYQGWSFVDLTPTTLPPASLVAAFAGAEIPVMLELDLAG